MEPPKPLPKKPYFPQGVFADDKENDLWRGIWYGKHLTAMNEPSLWSASRDRSEHSYRFLWLRTFEPPVSVRLVVRPNGTGEAVGVVTDGKGGYQPGRVVWHQKSVVFQNEITEILQKLAQIDFWSLPAQDPHRYQDDKGNAVVGMDGAEWILEGVQNGRYHLVDRWSPHSTPFESLCLRLSDLGNVPVKARAKIY